VSLSTANPKAAQELLARISDVAAVEIDPQDGRVTAFPRKGRAIFQAVTDALRQGDLAVSEIALEQGRLDEVFRQITQPRRLAASEQEAA
jgi:ABC-2 type transport system ATP-binding protein